MAETTSTTAQAKQAIDLQPIRDILAKLPGPADSRLIGILQQAQDAYGYLPEPVMDEISRLTKIPVSRIYGVATFYAQFYLKPRGRHTVRCCLGSVCNARGAPRVLATVEKTLGVTEGESTADYQFHLETAACLGVCLLAPVMMVGSQYFGAMSAQRVERVLKMYGREKR
ncbi:MAG: NAD(P)H-dependent oxidoreductase subunit E [Planctomycetes bacterium]|nr:NAD(P)H-dependent oxidoreductase subunit E [Planctomycetota bacterium]